MTKKTCSKFFNFNNIIRMGIEIEYANSQGKEVQND